MSDILLPTNVCEAGTDMVQKPVVYSSTTKYGDDPISELKNMMLPLHQTAQHRSEERHAENKIHFEQCVQRWQGIDTRVTKVEQESADHHAQLVEQNIMNCRIGNRLNVVEDEVVALRRDLARLVSTRTNQVDHTPPPTMSSSILTSSSKPGMSVTFDPSISVPDMMTSFINPVNASVNPCNQTRFTCYGSPERVQDAVGEFSGQSYKLHPERFLQQMDSYFGDLCISTTQQLATIQRRLTEYALMWYESLMPAPQTYQDFCVLFRQRFWSEAAQRKARNDVLRPFSYDRYNGLATHAMKWIASAKYLSPPFDQQDLVSIIIQHFPTPLNMALRGRNPITTNELLAVLTEFEESTPSNDNYRSGNHRNDNHRRNDNRRDENRGYDNRRNDHPTGGDRYRSGNNQYQRRGNNGQQTYQPRISTQQTPPSSTSKSN